MRPAGFAAGTTLTVFSGADDRPVPAAIVRIAGQELRTDASGEIRFATAVDVGVMLSIDAEGFFQRRTRLRTLQDLHVGLWPRETPSIGVTEEYTRRLVYGSGGGPTVLPLRRLAPAITHVTLLPDAAVRAVPETMSDLRAAAARATAATGVSFGVDSRAPGAAVVEVQAPGNEPCGPNVRACIGLDYSGLEITGGRMSFAFEQKDLAYWGMDSILHELGHLFGLHHSGRRGDLMDVSTAARRDRADFTPAEYRSLRLLFQRRAGNLFPDDDAALQVQSRSRRRELIVCD
jgi:hypothetical protein